MTMMRRTPTSKLFPYTTLFRSAQHRHLLVEGRAGALQRPAFGVGLVESVGGLVGEADRKSTRLNSSHMSKSYAVVCLKKKRQVECVTRARSQCASRRESRPHEC